MSMRRLIRWKAIVPLALLVVLLGMGWMLFLDRAAEHVVERAGTYLVGARVDVASADVRVAEGSLVLRGLEVTNPDAPMSNLFEAAEIVADLRVGLLLERRVAIETLAVRGVQLNTPREESGALAHPPAESGRIREELAGWAEQVQFPPFSLEGLGQAVDLDAVQPENLRSLTGARRIVGLADSADERWSASLAGLDPREDVEAARALIGQLRDANPLRLGPRGIVDLASSARTTTANLAALRGRVAALDSTTRGDLGTLGRLVNGLAGARAADLAAARGMLRLPSLRGPEISPALFGDAAVGWVEPLLYWLRVAEEYLPPGLQPQRFAGPSRARRPGTTVRYPGSVGPAFLVEFAEAELELGGTGAAQGQYLARLTGLSSAPALTGPMELRAVRDASVRGPGRVELAATLRHGAHPVADSLRLLVDGFTLPELAVPALGARLAGDEGRLRLDLARTGEEIDGRLEWSTGAARWLRSEGAPQAAGLAGRFEDVVWRALGDLQRVEISVRIRGAVTAPRLDVRSNVGSVLAESVRRELGRELEEAEARIRQRVDALVEAETTLARDRVAALEARARERIRQPLAEIRQVEQELQAEIDRAARRLPGFRLPGGAPEVLR